MIPNLTLPEIDEEIVRTIKTRAELTGQSIEAVAQQALKLGLLLDIPGRVAAADSVRRMTPKPLQEDSTELIRRLRDAP